MGRLIRIGSAAGNDLLLPHRSVSARHASIRHTLGKYYLRDLGSTNGTFLNGTRIETEQELHPGDEIRFGAARFALVARAKLASSIFKYVGVALGLVLLAGGGYLGVEFVNNWENLEKLSATSSNSAPASVSRRTAVSSMSELHPLPIAPVAEVTPPSDSSSPVWLAAINEYRARVKLPPVVEDPKLSEGDRKHAMYVVKNYEDKVGPGHLIGAEMHEEEQGNPWYSPEGQDAGEKSDINQLWGPEKSPSPMWALNKWLDGPFHRLWILSPTLTRVGYGEFCEKRYCVAALDLGSGAETPRSPAPLASPIEFPPANSIITRNSFAGEWPSPLTSCPGYSFPAGMPATIQLGEIVDAKLSEYQITRGGHGVESCGIDGTNYQNPVSAEQERGRAILTGLGAAIIIPRYPLKPGNYSVTATLNDHAYQWSFMVAGAGGGTASVHPAAPSKVVAATPPGEESASSESTTTAKNDLEAAIRAGYARVVKGDSAGRAEYAGDASKATASATLAAAKLREFMRRREAAFLEGPGAVAPVDSAQWLAELNRDRAAVELPPVVEDPALSDGDLKHARYVVMNYPARAQLGGEMHGEDPSKPGYTTEGNAAAKQSNVAPYWYNPPPAPLPPATPSVLFINVWLAAPFHRASILFPDLHHVGFGQFCQERACAAALDTSEALKPVSDPAPFAKPVFFPPQKYPVALVDLPGEWPNPASSCSGYTFPVGLPITIQLGNNFDAHLSSYALTQGSKPVEACGYDAMTYVNPNADDQARARTALHWNGEVVIVPRMPLERGATYEVSATVNDQPYHWSFTVSR